MNKKFKPTLTAAPPTPTPTAPKPPQAKKQAHRLKATQFERPIEPALIAPALAQFDKLPDAAHVRLPVVASLNGVGPATVWRWTKSGRLPRPIKLGPNTTVWNVGQLRRAMAAASARA